MRSISSITARRPAAVSHLRIQNVTFIISQNGNAYLDGFSAAWEPWQTYWREPTPEHREACREALSPEVIRDWQYFHGADRKRVSPDGYTLDIAYAARSGADEIQFDLILDYRSNVAPYPSFQRYFRERQPPLLAAWGRNDPFHSSWRHKPISATCQRLKCICLTPATLPSRLTQRKFAS
jgi:hypothetical protein